jgi:hypothetical protein
MKIGYNMTHNRHITFQFFSYWIRDCENGILVNKKIKKIAKSRVLVCFPTKSSAKNIIP